MDIILIAAVAENGVIGSDGEMPWHYPKDLERFKEVTLGHPVIMGRVTYESIVDRLGGPLPDRVNVVLTHDPDKIDTTTAGSDGGPDEGSDATEVHAATAPDEAVAVARSTGTRKAFVAGGGTIYEQFLPVADRMMLTEIHQRPDGDTTFPEWDRERWVETSREDHDGFAFVTYEPTDRP